MADNYTRIIEVAIKLMSENGYVGTSLQMIADNVGIKKASIFHHFEKKEAILLAIFQEAVPAATYDLMLLVNDEKLNGTEKLKKFIRTHMRYISEKGEVLKVYLSEFRYLGKRNREEYLDRRRLYTDLVEQIVKELQKEDADRFKGLDPSIVANGILGMCNWAVTWYEKGGRLSMDEISDQLFQMTRFSQFPQKN